MCYYNFIVQLFYNFHYILRLQVEAQVASGRTPDVKQIFNGNSLVKVSAAERDKQECCHGYKLIERVSNCNVTSSFTVLSLGSLAQSGKSHKNKEKEVEEGFKRDEQI